MKLTEAFRIVETGSEDVNPFTNKPWRGKPVTAGKPAHTLHLTEDELGLLDGLLTNFPGLNDSGDPEIDAENAEAFKSLKNKISKL